MFARAAIRVGAAGGNCAAVGASKTEAERDGVIGKFGRSIGSEAMGPIIEAHASVRAVRGHLGRKIDSSDGAGKMPAVRTQDACAPYPNFAVGKNWGVRRAFVACSKA